MEEIERQLAARDRFLRRRALARTPEQRIELLWQMQREAFAVLRANPEAYAHFLRRNFKARRSLSFVP